MPKKYTYEYIHNYFKEQKCKLLDTEYKNNSTKMKYQCKCGNLSSMTFANFKKGKRCRKCCGTEKLTYEFVKLKFEERGCILISTEYINAKSKLEFICKCKNKYEIAYSHFIGVNNCRNCTDKAKLSYEYVYNYFKEHKCELLDTEYKNYDTKMKYKCNCGNISNITFDSFKQGTRCMNCKGTPKYTQEYVESFFEKNDCKLLGEYINAKKKVKYICICKNESEITFGHFQKGVRCQKCSGTETLTFDFVKEYFEKSKCILISTEYINAKTNLNYICECGNESNISYDSFRKGSRCKSCRGSHTEKIVLDFLEDKYTNIISQPKYDWCKNITYLPFDFSLENKKTILEIDGGQHFKQVSNWKSPEETQERDLYKMKCALENGYRIIRIFQEDIFNNVIDWKTLLENAINNDEKVVFISKDPSLYENYKIIKKSLVFDSKQK